jgi:acetyl esterase/lipase
MPDEKKESAEDTVRRVERWPDDVELPAGVIAEDAVYGSPGGRDLELTFIRREKDPERPRPAVVFMHGGGWKFGDRAQFYRQAARLAERYDIFGASIFYRMSGEAAWPAALHDCKCAVRWVRSVADKHRIDTSRIAVAGGSAGAQLAAMVATTNGVERFEGDGGHPECSSDVHLAILFNGHFDLVHTAKMDMAQDMLAAFLGGTLEEVPDVYREASPVQWATKDSPPMLFLHGDRDPGVCHSFIMAKRLEPLGVPAEVEIYEGKEHAWFNKDPDWRITLERVEGFLVKYFGVEQTT